MDPIVFLLLMWNPEHWDLTHSMIWTNKTKTGRWKQRKVVRWPAGALALTKETQQELPRLLKKQCQNNSRCSKGMTSATTSRVLRKIGGCCTRAPPGPRSQAASFHWSLPQGTNAERSIYLSLLLCLYPYVCLLWSALTAHHAGASTKRKQPLWNLAESLQSKAATSKRATRSLCWNRKGKKEQRRSTQRSWPPDCCQKVRTSSLLQIFKMASLQLNVLFDMKENVHFFQIQPRKNFTKAKEKKLILNLNSCPMHKKVKKMIQHHLLGKTCTFSLKIHNW